MTLNPYSGVRLLDRKESYSLFVRHVNRMVSVGTGTKTDEFWQKRYVYE
jgi:hypothetical protein